ncbi:MAG TPA: GNAT family N-acetyltransferase [Candidatus Dormibacteraeota bacterium]|jgi:RimJ/RimL family protein N-acetyltransferase
MATRSALRVTRLGPADAGRLAALIDREPVTNVYLRSELRLGFEVGDWWGAFEDDELTAVVLGWSLVVPYIPDVDAAVPLAQALAAAAQPRMVVGHRASVMALHNAFRPPRPARELRDPQPLLILAKGDLGAAPSPEVRLSTRDDLEALILAAARMHREEMGIDPLAIDAPAWRSRMISLIERRWSWIWMRGHEVVFKAELSAWTPEVVQIQGVYTAPQHRGRGIARAGLAAVCEQIFREVPRCSLYVNQYNVIAQRVYEHLGFKPADVFATVMY